MREENKESVKTNKKQKLMKDSEEDMNDSESITSVSDNEFDRYLSKLKF